MSKPSDQQILHQDGFDVVLKQWNDIMVLALTDAEKTERCVAIVQDHIDHLKERNAQKKNPVLRLSADLIILSELLNSECEVGKVCESGARSAGRLVGLLLFGSSVMLQPNLDLTDSLSVDLKKPDRDWRYPRKGVAEYWEVARKWGVIDDLPITVEEKIYQCLVLFHDYMRRLALSCLNKQNPTLRFYTYMLEVRSCMRGFCDLPITKVYVRWMVDAWLANNSVGRAYPIDIQMDNRINSLN